MTWALTLLLAAGCAPEAADTAAALPCGEVVTWATFGEGFTRDYCQVCHASTAPDRHGAPASVTFDTEAEALALADRIRARAGGLAPDMPPGGGVPEDELALLACWLGP